MRPPGAVSFSRFPKRIRLWRLSLRRTGEHTRAVQGGLPMNVAQLFFSFTGRVNRAKYWVAIVVFIIIALISLTVGYVGEETPALHVLGFVIDIALLIAGLAVGAKRLHDRDKSAWWLLVFYILPSVLLVIGALMFFYGIGAESAGGVIGNVVFYALGLGVLIWAIVELGFLRGTIGAEPVWPRPPRRRTMTGVAESVPSTDEKLYRHTTAR